MNKEMNVIITMGGIGSRFKKAGYNVPKYMIEAKGRTLFDWSMDSLVGYNEYVEKYIFVVRKEDSAESFIREHMRAFNMNDIEIVEIDYLTDGQATTAMLALPFCSEDKSIMIYNIDTYIEARELQYKDIKGEGYIPCFHADGDHWSFVRLNQNGMAVEVKEKERISDNCTIGAYYFASAFLYKDVYGEYYSDDNNLTRKEKYIAPMYDYMISKGMDVRISIVDSSKVHVLGTPEELKEFIDE